MERRHEIHPSYRRRWWIHSRGGRSDGWFRVGGGEGVESASPITAISRSAHVEEGEGARFTRVTEGMPDPGGAQSLGTHRKQTAWWLKQAGDGAAAEGNERGRPSAAAGAAWRRRRELRPA
uniref:Uncharacterized protein n=1 Tax=Oryza sativa subsp. japonica TaxID=39947 RepID=Q851W6_ORYSJ|nr:hypothetical protein [Oryza sativa Japonica Group]